MRIVLDLQGAQSGSRNRGIGRYSLSLAKAIVRNQGEHEVIIALSGLFPDTIAPIRVAFDDLLPQENICVWHAPGPVRHLEPANNWRGKAAELIREGFLVSLNPDIVLITSHFEGWLDDAVTSIKLLAQTIPTAVTFYDLIPLIYRTTYLANPLEESRYENKIGHLRRADLLLSISESTRQEGIKYLGFPPDKVINISTAADPQFHCIDISAATECSVRNRYSLSQQIIMYTGGIDHRKNIEGLIRAYALLPKALRENHQLAIVCSANPDSRRLLETLAKQQGLAENEIILTGFVSDEDLIALYHLCKVFVFPSWHEGFGLPALEAMSCGAAVIGANTSSVPEVIGREDALFDPFDDRAIAEKLTQVLTDSDYRAALSHHGLEQAKKFSWDESAKRAIQAMVQFHAARENSPQIFSLPRHRPKLAYISPLPPERSGIADYSAELLPELARHYDIEVIVAQENISDPWIKANCAVRGVDWFVGHASGYERVLYHFGNSLFHQHMFDLVKRVPGVVVLHDFFLSGIVAHMDLHGFNPHGWARELYRAHGYRAIKERFHANDTWNLVWKYPCNKSIVENARGIIVHSNHSCRLAGQWLGDTCAQDWSVIPHLRIPTISVGRAEARKAMGLDEDVFLVCSFGLLSPTKQNRRLLDAWIASVLSTDERCFLVFVGENDAGGYSEAMTAAIFNSGLSDRISITGWMDTTQFRQYLAAADVAVQLRTSSRGETSGTVLDCMNYGLPTIVNAHGSMADLPDDAVWMLPDEFDEADLSQALETLWQEKEKRHALGRRAREVILTRHTPRNCADQYARAIERYYDQALTLRPEGFLVEALAKIEGGPADEGEWMALAKDIVQNHNVSTEKHLLVDISELVQRDAKSGIQRVVRSVLSELLANPPRGFRVEPVYAGQGGKGYHYARQFTLRFLGCPVGVLEDEPIEACNGDIFLGLDLQQDFVTHQADFYQHLRRLGVQVYFVIYDLLPVLLPEAFPKGSFDFHTAWLQTVAQADGAICISRSVMNEMAHWLNFFDQKRLRPFKLGWFHLGADIMQSVPTTGFPPDASQVFDVLSRRPTFLMVGDLIPRKGHMQTLAAFERLWTQGVDVNLVIVGKQGWMVETLIGKLRKHPERHRRLFWLQGISDEYLEKVYVASTCLIAASEGEGFSLPLIEAAQHQLPIIARDIPVFHEVAGEHAFYFSGATPDDLADGVQAWLALYKASQAPRSDNMPWLTWEKSTQNLLDMILGGNWYQKWMPDDLQRFCVGSCLYSKVGKRLGRDIVSTGQAGPLIYGPYIPLDAGQYQVVIRGSLGEGRAAAARVDVAIDQGRRILAESVLTKFGENGCLVSLPISLEAPCTDFEVRVWVDGHSEVTISMLEIKPVLEGAENQLLTGCVDISLPAESPDPPIR
jgi:glycosyltransferase involved in cell wall biosynthesis